MLRQHLLIIAAVCAGACAQIAGFEEFSGREANGGSSSAAGSGGGAANGGVSSTGGEVSVGGASAGTGTSGGASAASGGTADGGGTSSLSGGSGGTGSGAAGAAGGAGAGGAGGIGGCDQQLLFNADFEAGPVQWQENSPWPGITDLSDIIVERSDPDLVEAGVEPQDGDYLAWLGGVPDSQQSWRINLLQDVTIPEDVTRLVVSGWIRIDTSEPENDARYDQLDIALQDEEQFWSFHVWDNRDVSDWQHFEYDWDDLEALRGRTLTFIAESTNDSGFTTSFWLDSLTFVAECGR